MDKETRRLINLALKEDLQKRGDITSCYFIDKNQQATVKIISKEKEPVIISGTEIAKEVFLRVDKTLKIKILKKDSSKVKNKETILEVKGSLRSVLTAERTALNFLQHLSGVATITQKYVAKIKGTKAKILDTRKTLPAYRALEKKAVKDGGGFNHRMGLYDAVMIKDNHLAGGIENLPKKAAKIKAKYPSIMIEAEADNLEQVKEFLTVKKIDRILLDNMNTTQLKKAVALNNKQKELEASGGITLKNIKKIAQTGINFISVGAITHSVRAVDLSLECC